MPTSLKQQLGGGSGGMPIGSTIRADWREDKVTLPDGTVWLKAGVTEENIAQYPDAPTTFVIDKPTLTQVVSIAGSSAPNEKPRDMSGNSNYVFFSYPDTTTGSQNDYIRRYDVSTGALQKYTAPFSPMRILVNSTHVWLEDTLGQIHQFDMQMNSTGLIISEDYTDSTTSLIAVSDQYVVANNEGEGRSVFDTSGNFLRTITNGFSSVDSPNFGGLVGTARFVAMRNANNEYFGGLTSVVDYHGNVLANPTYSDSIQFSDNILTETISFSPNLNVTRDKAFFVTYITNTVETNIDHTDLNLYSLDTKEVIRFKKPHSGNIMGEENYMRIK